MWLIYSKTRPERKSWCNERRTISQDCIEKARILEKRPRSGNTAIVASCTVNNIQSELIKVQNSLARVIFPSLKRSDHITPALVKLHWLPIHKRIKFKIIAT